MVRIKLRRYEIQLIEGDNTFYWDYDKDKICLEKSWQKRRVYADEIPIAIRHRLGEDGPEHDVPNIVYG
jgi:hypothetical protein